VPLGAHRARSGESRQVEASHDGRRFRPSRALAAGIAAIILAAGTLGWLGWLGWRGGATYATETGEQRTIRLSDDSLVDLNEHSSIRVRFSKSERLIDLLRGQALFRVARDPQRPFIVRSDHIAVRAVGTQFDVYRKGDSLVVTVVEGRVAVTPQSQQPDAVAAPSPPAVTPADTQLLSAGEQLTVTPKFLAPKPRHADVGTATAWAQRRLTFEDTPLADVAEEFNRFSVRRLVIEDPELARKTISGVYSSNEPDALIGFLRAQPMLEVVETDREIRVARHGVAGSANTK